MKVILDECLPRRLASEIINHEVTTVPAQGWQGTKNGALLNLIQKEFNVFITVDRNLAFQQNMKNLQIAVIILHASTNRFEDLKPLIPAINEHLLQIKPGMVVTVGTQGAGTPA